LIKCAKRNFIEWERVDVFHKNNFVWKLALRVIIELVDQKSGMLGRNLGWYFYLSELEFVLLNHVKQLFLEIKLALKYLRLNTKLDRSSLFIDVNLIGVDKILKCTTSAYVFVDLDQVKKLCEFNDWQLYNENASIKKSFPVCKPLKLFLITLGL
jgi:hypothetical protein